LSKPSQKLVENLVLKQVLRFFSRVEFGL